MPASYFLLILREHGKTAAARKALLDGTGVRENEIAAPGAEITIDQLERLLRNATRLLKPGWALSMGTQLSASTHGPLGFATVSAPTLGKSLEVVARFGHVRAPFFKIRASSRGGAHRLVIEERVTLGADERAMLLEMILLSAQALGESVLGRPMKEAAFELPYPAPSYATSYADHFHGPVKFGCSEAAVTIPSGWLKLECPLADPVMFEASLRSLETGDRKLEGTSYAAARVEQLIASQEERLGLEEAARMMRVSRRTLVRRLRAAGTGYRGLVESHLRRRAEVLLRDPQLTIAEIAYSLGYEDPANFGRACRRWFGMSPGKHRTRMRQ